MAAVLAALCVGALALRVQAHELDADPLPDAPGWRLGGDAALVLPRADARWPSASWPGVLTNGSAPRDERGGLRQEHATLDLAARLGAHLGAHVAAGWHDRDGVHTEAATLQGRFRHDGDDIALQLGRDIVRLGAVIDTAGHFDRFSEVPLAKRAVLNGEWIDDGLALAWRRSDADGLRAVETGLWRGRVFPGGPAGPLVPSLHLHAGWGHLDAHLSAAHFEPEARGAAAQSAGAAGTVGHVHGSLDCRASLQQRVCFDGTSDVLGASLQWEPAASDWSFAFAGLLRRERGVLYSTSGSADWRERIAGAWADAVWQAAPRWTLAARVERLVPSNRLEGTGTALLAQEAGLVDGGAVERVTLAALYVPHEFVTLALEGGHERYAGGRVSHVALRAIVRNPRWLGGSW